MDYRYSAQAPQYEQNYNEADQAYDQPAAQLAGYPNDRGNTAGQINTGGEVDHGYPDMNGYNQYQDPNYVQESTQPSLSDYNSHET